MISQKEHNVHLQFLNLMGRLANHLVKENNPENSRTLKELSSFISNGCTALEYNQAINKIFESHISKIESSLGEIDADDILNSYNNEILKLEKSKLLQKSEKYQELLCLLSVQHNQADDEVVAVSQSINNIDPITKLPIIEPVKNSKCGHIYEKSSIMSLIRKNPKTKCPFPGCIAANCVLQKDLISDYAFKRMHAEKGIENLPKKSKVCD